MADIDAWIESELKKGTPARKIKQLLKAKGYGPGVVSGVEEAETPLQRILSSKIRLKKFSEAIALLIAIIALLFGALYSYNALYKPSAEEIVLNLSEVYGNVSVMKVVGNSMEPAFSDGQVVFVAGAHYQNNTPMKGDVGVVYFNLSGDAVIKRIAALPLEKIDENEEYLQGTLLSKQLSYYNYTVPPGMLILLGDNAEKSMDSRYYGIVPVASLKGKVVK